MKSNPFYPFYVGNITNEVSNMTLPIYINTIISEFLRNNLKLFYAFFNQFFYFLKDFFFRATCVFSRNQGDSTISALTIAAFRNFHVCIMARCCQMTATIARRNIGLTKICQQLLIIEFAIKLVYFWNLLL